MRKAIHTKYHGPTNSNGARVSAKTEGGNRALAHWDHAENTEGNHCAAALALAAKLEWRGLWIGGGSADGNGYCFVWAGDKRPDASEARATIGTEGRDWFFQSTTEA